MKAPQGTTIIATPLANCWLDRQIVFVDNVNCDRTAGNVQIHYKILQSIVGDKKVRWLKQFPLCKEFDRSVKEIAASVLPGICCALAIVTAPEATGAISKSYRDLKKQGIPVEIFENEQSARKWLDLYETA